MPYSLICSSSASESYALSPISLSGSSSRKHPARTASTSLHSAGEALSTATARGRPSPEAIATILVPLPRLVGPTAKPPFWRSQKSHPRTLRPGAACLAHADVWPAGAVPPRSYLRQPIAENAGGRSGREDTWPASRPTARRCPESRARRSAPRACRARDGRGCPRAAPDARLAPHFPLFVCQFPTGRHISPRRRLEQLQFRRKKISKCL